MNYVVLCKPRVVTVKTNAIYLPEEIHEMLSEYRDIVVDDLPNELPPKRDISHHIDFIPRSSLPTR